MASKAQAGRKTVVSIGGAVGSGNEATLVVIGEVSGVPLKAPKWNFEDVTNFDSDSDMEYLTTIRGDGSVTLTMNRVGDDAGQQAVQEAAANGLLFPFKITLPKTQGQSTVGDSLEFNAYVLSTGDIDIAPTKKIGLSIDLKISGKVTPTPGS